MAKKLTGKLLQTLPGPPGALPYIIHWDTDVPGFGVRITRAGARSFILNYRARGVQRRMTLGTLPAGARIDETDKLISQARNDAAKKMAGAKYEGRDPMADRHEDRAKPTVARMAERYLEEHAPKKRPSSQGDDRRMIEGVILPALRNKRVSDVDYSDVDALHRKVTKTGAPIRANRVVALLSKMFALAIKWKWRLDNPCKGIERNAEERRQRYMTGDELRRLSAALETHSKRTSANAVRLLLLTGARRGEVLSAAWEQFDLDAGVWTKPSSHTKQKKEHRVPLSGPARLLLNEMREAAERAGKEAGTEVSRYLFPGIVDGKAQTDLKHFWASICKEAKITGVRVHDLRHTYASVLVNAGQGLPIIGALLGHTNPKTTARYAHLFDDPLRAATERAGATIQSASNAPKAEVIPMPKRRGAKK